jgi:hypothetical protein
MARVVVLGADYRASLREVGIRQGSETSLAIGRAIRELAGASELLGAGELQGLAPRPDAATFDVWGYFRQVTGTGLGVWYRIGSEAQVVLLAVVRL